MPRRNIHLMAMVAAVSLLCWQATHGGKPKDEMMELYGLFVDAVEQVETNYVRPVNRRELLESALKGMLQNLDPHSQFIPETEWKAFKKQIDGEYGGIGIQVDIDDDTKRLKVVAPMVGTPAYAAGVLSGDIIMEIDGLSTEGMDQDKAIEVLQGRIGTPVKLQVRHEADGKLESLSMVRSLINVPSVLGDTRKADDSWDFMLDHERKIGYVRITSFIHNTTDELKQALAQLKEEGMKALILDLRDDPGGLLSAAVEICDLFVDDGTIVSTKGRNTPTKTYEAQKNAKYTGFPMVVMVNQNSASASEIVSACLQDHKRAKVVGQRSFGKGSVQNILELEDGTSVLKLTVAAYFRPSGKNIHRFKNAKDTDVWGVSPDDGLEVKLTTPQYFNYLIGRRERDLHSIHKGRKAAAEAPKTETAKADKPAEKKDEPAKTVVAKAGEADAVEHVDTPKGEWTDLQLTKAREVINDALAIAQK